MKLDLSEIARIVGKRYHYEINEPPIVDETIVCVEPIRGAIDFANTGRLIVARGKLSTTIELECSRCLGKFTTPVSSEIEEGFPIPNPAFVDEEDEEAPKIGEDEREPLFIDNVLDLTELLRQTIILAAPIRPLCREACKGLCANCGRNLNEGQCDCIVNTEGSPFSKLGELLEDQKNEP